MLLVCCNKPLLDKQCFFFFYMHRENNIWPDPRCFPEKESKDVSG